MAKAGGQPIEEPRFALKGGVGYGFSCASLTPGVGYRHKVGHVDFVEWASLCNRAMALLIFQSQKVQFLTSITVNFTFENSKIAALLIN